MTFRSHSLLCLALVAVTGACASHQPVEPSYAALIAPSTRAPANKLERTVLAKLDQLAVGTKTAIEGESVVVDAKYLAASGRTCRRITVLGKQQRVAKPTPSAVSTNLAHGAERKLHTLDKISPSHRAGKASLACLVDDAWSFVPNVLRGPEDDPRAEGQQ